MPPSLKNRAFKPVYFPCDACHGGHISPETFFKLKFQRLAPARKGTHFVDLW